MIISCMAKFELWVASIMALGSLEVNIFCISWLEMPLCCPGWKIFQIGSSKRPIQFFPINSTLHVSLHRSLSPGHPWGHVIAFLPQGQFSATTGFLVGVYRLKTILSVLQEFLWVEPFSKINIYWLHPELGARKINTASLPTNTNLLFQYILSYHECYFIPYTSYT